MATELKIDATEDTPGVHFDADTGIFKLYGRSLPEDAFWFYNPVLEWLTDYAKNALPLTEFHFDLEYFNTASAKQIFKISNILCELSKTKTVKVNWHYDEGDRDMFSSGGRFSKLCGMPFELIKN